MMIKDDDQVDQRKIQERYKKEIVMIKENKEEKKSMKTAIIYYSRHHSNTKKLVDAIAATHDVDLIDAAQTENADLSAYDCIGLASGIYGGSFAKPLLQFAEQHLPAGKKVFLLYTCAIKMKHYTNNVRKVVRAKRCKIIGAYSCPGYNTFGPFKLIGGTSKGHPTQEEIQAAVTFFEGLGQA